MKRIAASLIALSLAACGGGESPGENDTGADAPAATPAAETAAPAPEPAEMSNEARLEAALAAQSDEIKARYEYRNPKETLLFFGIEPGMTVVEALPGGGWYTKILLDYLGEDGKVIGADYALDMWPLFDFMTDARLLAKESWVGDWTATAEGWRNSGDAAVGAFMFGALPESMHGTADAVLFIRALHNLARFEEQGDFLSEAIDDAWNVLKPGGIVGVVQHHARDEMSDTWASGEAGYLKKGYVIAAMQARGFDFIDESDVNANPADTPTESEFVWRLPPSLQTSVDNPRLREQMEAIGESNRMTLRFRKPLN